MWTKGKWDYQYEGGVYFLQSDTPEGIVTIGQTFTDTDFIQIEDGEANAQRIVQCCNLHDDLVEALENVREELDEDHIHDREDCTGDCPVCIIDDVLAKL